MTRRHLTTGLTLVFLVALLAVAAVVGAKALFAPLPDSGPAASASAAPTCRTKVVKKGQHIRSRQVVVSVFNAGTRARLADRTLTGLAKRGFHRGEAGNAPAKAKPRFVQVWTTKKNDAAAKLVALQFGPHTLVRVVPTSLGPGVDVIVGNDFRGLKKAPRSLTVSTKQTVCLPPNA
ncbi:MAG: LytR C-terminal domain-containing protein [Nocardioidaceae bacterium]